MTLDYEKIVETALRGVVKECLQYAAKHGLSDKHHFYITFSTRAAGVIIPEYLKSQYPEEMTIVLQHQFWDLQIKPHYFSVVLSFNRVSEAITIPYSAITGFADPSVNFGLRFEVVEEDSEDDLLNQTEAAPTLPAFMSAAATDADPAGNGIEGAKVIALEHFRKKKNS